MSLPTGARLGPYELIEPIGAGGMGEVYKARDTRLDRIVAVKVSADRFSERFEREARLISSLNHPRICTVHDVGPNYLVLEFVPGDTLADRIARGPLPLAEALPLARQIVEALEVAHQSGVIHRDLKPANIKLTAEGDVKVLDFGLAKVAESALAASNPAASPTLTLEATRAGMILGTAAYMPPEQARGAVVDKRADVWAFGCVLFEMLAGKRVFEGGSTTDVLAAVVRAEPDWSALPDDTPASILRLLKRCLDKDRKRRLPDIGVARLEIDDALTIPQSAPSPPTPSSRLAWLAAVAALVIGAAAGAWWHASRAATGSWVPTLMGGGANATCARISPDGQLLAFLTFVGGLPQVGVMKPDGHSWTVLTSDRANGGVSNLEWAHDGSRIYFDRYWGVPRGIYAIPPLGGEPRLLLDDAFGPGPLPDGGLIAVKFTGQGDMQLYRFHPDSGKLDALPIFLLSTDTAPLYRVSQDGKKIAFIGLNGAADRANTVRLWTYDLASGATRALDSPPRSNETMWRTIDWSPAGDVVYVIAQSGDERKLIAVPATGGAYREVLSTPISAPWEDVEVAPDGSLYLSQVIKVMAVQRFSDQGAQGRQLGTTNVHFTFPQPDGEFLIGSRDGGRSRLLIGADGAEPKLAVESSEETATPAVLFGGKIAFLIGSGDGRRIAVASLRDGRVQQRFSANASGVSSLSASPDGKSLYYASGGYVWEQSVAGGEPRRLIEGTSVALDPAGRYLYVRRSRNNTDEVFRAPIAGGPEELLPAHPEELRFAINGLSSGAVDAAGRVLVTVLRPDSFYYSVAVIDPAHRTFTRVPIEFDGDVYQPARLANGDIAALTATYRHSIWHYVRH
jgi:eukaryotic-like serine/threonine-protein kinase